jgi:4-amino-4-deoxy-L-arabinose transferase-like glycosyltransferase
LAGVDADERAVKNFNLSFILLAAIQLAAIALTRLSLAPDEAHYWEWSRRLDWSYYSKGPLVAAAIKFGTTLFGDTAFGVRFPAAMFYLLSVWILWRAILLVSPPRIAFPVWLSGATMIILLQSGVAITTDGPCAASWAAGLYCALRTRDDRRWWLGLGLAVGIGMLAKFTLAILFLSVGLFYLVSRRRELISSWPYFGAVAAGIAMSPVIYWNSQNGWVNFAHNAGHVVKSGKALLAPQHLPELIGGQLGLVGPLLFLALMMVFFAGIRRWRDGDEISGLLVCTAAPLLVLCLLVSLSKSVYANWPLPAYLGLLPLSAHLLSRNVAPEFWHKWRNVSLKLNLFLAALAYLLYLGVTAGLPAKILPTKKLTGWSELGAAVDGILESEAGKRFAGVISDEYGTSSEIAFYSKLHPRTYCALLGDRRMNQYDVWGGWGELKGKDLLIVLRTSAVPAELAGHFSSVTPVGAAGGLPVIFSGSELHRYYFFSALGYDGFIPESPARR